MDKILIKCSGKEFRDISELKPFQGNLKELAEPNYQKLKGEILKNGFCEPISVWKDNILNGHQRLKVLQRLRKEGYEVPKIPVNIIEAESTAEAKRIVLALTSQYGTMTQQSLFDYMREVELSIDELSGRFAFPEINIDEFEKKYFRPEPDKDLIEDEVPEVEDDKAVTKAGDVIELGKHRLICGDCLNTELVTKLMQDKKTDLIVTDPPYNIDYEGKTEKKLKIKNDKMSSDDFYKFITGVYQNYISISGKGTPIYVFHGDGEGVSFRKAMLETGWLLKQCLIWVKNTMVLGRQDYQWQHEPILYGWSPGATHKWYTDRKQTTVLMFNKPQRSDKHPTMKPIKLIEYLINNSSKRSDLVVDFFLGSGSTLIACEKTSRICYGFELDPVYCDVIIKRWSQYSGNKAYIRNGKPENIDTVY